LIVLILRRADTANVSAQIVALYQPGKLIDQRPEFKDKKKLVALGFPGFPPELKIRFLFLARGISLIFIYGHAFPVRTTITPVLIWSMLF